MSRKIDHKNLSDDDKIYLAQRGQLSTDIMSTEDQRALLDPQAGALSLYDRAHTGDVNLANVTKEDLEAELEKRQAAEKEAGVPDIKPEGLAAAEGVDDDESDPLEAPYNTPENTKGLLILEINRRNEYREDDDQLDNTGKKDELAAELDRDDAESE